MATGTDSGKTECFLLPVLEHCRQQLAIGQKGIKAILIYPMNALATDQAKGIAQLVHDSPALSGLRAGLYVGAEDNDPTIAMSAEGVITDKSVLQKAPPDILLTNYEQLDHLLLRPQVQGSGPTTPPVCSATWWWMSSTPSMGPRARIWPA